MKLYTLFLFSFLTVSTSCNGQNQKTAIGDTVSELDKTIFVVFQASNNDYWFGSDGQGVFRYDGKTIVHFTTKDGLCNNRIREIKEDKSGNIYFTTGSGISKFDGKTFTTISITSNSRDNWKLNPDDLWFIGAQDSGVVYRYDGKLLYRLEFPKTQEGDEHISKFPRSKFQNANYSPYDVYIIYNDNQGNVWFGTSSLGVCRYDGKSFLWISESDLEFDVDTGFGIRSIIEDNDENFWFSNTLFRYNFYGHINATNYRKEKGIGSLDGKKDGGLVAIISMAKGNTGEIWMATYNSGVWGYDGKKITHYPVNIDDKPITIFSIYKDNQGDLWLGTHEEGAYKFNGIQFEKFAL
jgi:ligand-binding sensor domain-containing protein